MISLVNTAIDFGVDKPQWKIHARNILSHGIPVQFTEEDNFMEVVCRVGWSADSKKKKHSLVRRYSVHKTQFIFAFDKWWLAIWDFRRFSFEDARRIRMSHHLRFQYFHSYLYGEIFTLILYYMSILSIVG